MILRRKKEEKQTASSEGSAILSREQMLNLIRRPLISEKSTQGSQFNQITFIVPKSARKPEIKAAVEGVFKVKVKAVNTSIVGGKEKVFRGRLGERSDRKKAIVTLAEGQSIDIGAGI